MLKEGDIWLSDDSPQLQVGGFWIDTGMSSHTVVRFNWHSRDKLKATSVLVGTC